MRKWIEAAAKLANQTFGRRKRLRGKMPALSARGHFWLDVCQVAISDRHFCPEHECRSSGCSENNRENGQFLQRQQPSRKSTKMRLRGRNALESAHRRKGRLYLEMPSSTVPAKKVHSPGITFRRIKVRSSTDATTYLRMG